MYYVDRTSFLATGLALALLLCGIWVGVRLRRRRQAKEQEKRQRAAIAAILEEVVARRARMAITFTRKGKPVGECSAAGVAVTDKAFTLACEARGLPSDLPDLDLTVFGQLTNEGRTSYASFKTTLLRSRRNVGLALLDVALPNELSTTQRRAFLRLSVTSGLVQGLHVWRADPPKKQTDGTIEKPRWESLAPGRVEVRDISAGGIGLLLPVDAILHMGDPVLISFCFTPPKQHDPTTLALMGRCVRLTLGLPRERYLAGILFVGVMRASVKSPKGAWVQLQPGEAVMELNPWVLHHDFQQRQKLR